MNKPINLLDLILKPLMSAPKDESITLEKGMILVERKVARERHGEAVLLRPIVLYTIRSEDEGGCEILLVVNLSDHCSSFPDGYAGISVSGSAQGLNYRVNLRVWEAYPSE